VTQARTMATPLAYAPIPRFNRGSRLSKLLNRKLHLPRAVGSNAATLVALARNPTQWLVRRPLARQLTAGLTGDAVISDGRGCSTFGPQDLPGLDVVVAECRAAYEALKAASPDGVVRSQDAKKDFQVYVLTDGEFARYPRILDFALSRPVIERVCGYMREVPLLSTAYLYLTPPNDSVEHSQLFHQDGYSSRSLKLFVNIFDTSLDQGPFTFVPADASDAVVRKLPVGKKRLTDAEIDAAGGRGQAIQLVGPAGSGCFVDTSRCLHYGARQNKRERLILMFQYVGFYAPEPRSSAWQKAAAALPGNLDAVQRLVLGVR
jgi:hypothetical protein